MPDKVYVRYEYIRDGKICTVTTAGAKEADTSFLEGTVKNGNHL